MFSPCSQLCYNARMVNDGVYDHTALAEEDKAWLIKLSGCLPILADLSRADLLLYCSATDDRALVVAQAMPRSVTPLYGESYLGRWASGKDQPEVLRGLSGKSNVKALHTVEIRGATVARQVYPVRNARGQIIAVLVVDSYWLAYERQRRRSQVFQAALNEFRRMVLCGALYGAESLSPFGEHDGIMYVGADRRVRYMSGIASGLYRFLGYRDSLEGWRISDLETVDHQLVNEVLSERRCSERCDEQYGRTWIRKALPVLVPPQTPVWMRLLGLCPPQATMRSRGVFVLVHDATEALQTQRELESKMSMLREVHHRVKNNLQVIASLMRMQGRRVHSEEARAALQEGINRILSVAVVHDFLSRNAKGIINLQEVVHRILAQIQEGLVDPSKHLSLDAKGPDIWLPAERATQCALLINELVQNAIEHGMAERDEGQVVVELVDGGDHVVIIVSDNGQGLPEGFDLATSSNLGLRIVRSMVERDLRGTFALTSNHLTQAIIHFNKSVLGGD